MGEPKEIGKAKPPWKRLFEVLDSVRGSRICIVIKGYPDPDSIASSMALKLLAAMHDIKSLILYFEEISHYENRALVKKLEIEMEHYTEDFDFSRYDYLCFNDSQSADLPERIKHIPPTLVFVDHHKSLGNIKAKHLDVREYVGSCSSIYAEYLRESKTPLSTSDGQHIKIATALMHGIRSDTDNFITARETDYFAAAYLSNFLDPDLLAMVARQPISAHGMDITQFALQNKKISGTLCISGVKYVRELDRDGIGQAADFLLRREGIDTVLVYGIVGDTIVDGSLRTSSDTLDPDKFIKEVFGQDTKGHYYGGGRSEKGGFQIPLNVFSKCKDKELLWKVVKKTIEGIVFDKLGLVEEEDFIEKRVLSG